MADVFISYAHGNASVTAEQIAAELEKEGVSCWYRDRDMKPGDFEGVITRAIRECKIFLLILDNDAAKSQYVKSELYLAFRRRVNYEPFTIIHVVCTGEVQLPDEYRFLLANIQTFRACPPDADHIRNLKGEILRILRRDRRAAERERRSAGDNLTQGGGTFQWA